jgi:uncharacterized protein YhjY with autotransporter beta-barrel domain
MISFDELARRRRAPARSAFALAALASAAWSVSSVTFAQSDVEGPIFGPGLTGGSLSYANGIERAAAEANDSVFQALEPHCNPFGVLNQLPAPTYQDISSGQIGPGPLCTEDTFFVYLNARELVHSANELQGQGPTISSLGVDREGLGTALRWTAAEELAAQGSMATEFANGQLSSLAARISALRFGATGFGTAGLYDWLKRSSPMVAQVGGAATGGDTGEQYSPWGGFLNYGFGYGSRKPTGLEDAFDFDSSEITVGVDYRLRNNIVIGGILGISRQDIDFDESASMISVVDGGMESDGKSFMVFAMSQGERLTLSGSIGVQSIDYDIERNIKYPSFNPLTESVYSIAHSSPNADALVTTFGFGYAFNWGKLGMEPFLNVEHIDISIDAFSEQRSINLLSDSGVSRRFDLSVSSQDIESLKTSIGLRFQYVVTPRFGVIVPYWSIAAYREHQDDARTITAGYAALEDVLGTNTFIMPTDAPDESFMVASAGFSMVLRGGRQRQIDGPIAGGLMGFLQVSSVQNRRYIDDQVITGGFRYEF